MFGQYQHDAITTKRHNLIPKSATKPQPCSNQRYKKYILFHQYEKTIITLLSVAPLLTPNRDLNVKVLNQTELVATF